MTVGFVLCPKLAPQNCLSFSAKYDRRNFFSNLEVSHLVGLEHFYVPIYWVSNHPNWLFFSEGWPNHQPGIVRQALDGASPLGCAALIVSMFVHGNSLPLPTIPEPIYSFYLYLILFNYIYIFHIYIYIYISYIFMYRYIYIYIIYICKYR